MEMARLRFFYVWEWTGYVKTWVVNCSPKGFRKLFSEKQFSEDWGVRIGRWRAFCQDGCMIGKSSKEWINMMFSASMVVMVLGILWYGQCLEVVGFVWVGLLPSARTSWDIWSSSKLLHSNGACRWHSDWWASRVALCLFSFSISWLISNSYTPDLPYCKREELQILYHSKRYRLLQTLLRKTESEKVSF